MKKLKPSDRTLEILRTIVDVRIIVKTIATKRIIIRYVVSILTPFSLYYIAKLEKIK